MSTYRDFMAQIRIGKLQFSAVDDAIEEWHAGTSDTTLRDYLGMTREEYVFFIMNPDGFESSLTETSK